MFRSLLFISILFLFSCERDCQTCTVTIEDNFLAAELECLGMNSDYPYGYRVFVEFTDTYCNEELEELYLREGEVFEYFCNGVEASTITRLNCD
jgi:hypothetical protein